MARNQSVELFKQLMAKIPAAIAPDLGKAVDDQAQRLADAQRFVVPVDEGDLRESIQVLPGAHPLQRRVVAGGEKTTREVRTGSGVSYDYAMAQEFGTEETPASPFFWPTYRLMRSRLRAGISRRVKPALQKIVKVE